MVDMSTKSVYTRAMNTSLTPKELHFWRGFRKMVDRLNDAVNSAMNKATGLSAPEFGVLGILEEIGAGTAPQSQLLKTSAWDKSRLSHLLKRMEERRLVERSSAQGKGVSVNITALGRELYRKGQPIHAKAIRGHFFDKLNDEQLKALGEIIFQLEPPPDDDDVRKARVVKKPRG